MGPTGNTTTVVVTANRDMDMEQLHIDQTKIST